MTETRLVKVLVPCLSCRLATPAEEDIAALSCQSCGTSLPPPAQAAWLMLRDGAQYGPYAIAGLAAWAAEGRILPTDSVWYQGAPVRLEVGRLPPFGAAPDPEPAPATPAAPEPPTAAPAIPPLAEEPVPAEPEPTASEPVPAEPERAAAEPAPAEPEPIAAEPASAEPERTAAEPAPIPVEAAAPEPAPADAPAPEPEPAPVEAAVPEPAPVAAAAQPRLIVHIPCLNCRIATPVPEETAAVSCQTCATALPPPAQAAWYMLRDGGQFGPYTTGQLAGYIAERRILPTDSVWYQGAAVRLEVSQLPPFGEVEEQASAQPTASEPAAPDSAPAAPALAPLPADGSDWDSAEVQPGETKVDSWVVSLWSMGIETAGSLTVTDRRLLFKPKFGGRSLVGMVISQTKTFKNESTIIVRRDEILSVRCEKRMLNKYIIVTIAEGDIHFNRGVMSADPILAALQPR